MEQKIIEIVKKYSIEDEKVSFESNLATDLCIDSLQMMQIIWDIEQTFQVDIKYTKLKNVQKVEDLVNILLDEV